MNHAQWLRSRRHDVYAFRLTLRSVRTMSAAARVCAAVGDERNARILAIMAVRAVRRLNGCERFGL